MESIEENTIILIKNGKKKEIKLPDNGKVVIQVQNGSPVRVEEVIAGRRFEDI